MKEQVKRTDRGWAGHFICASSCRYRRNTLLECGDVRVVVSTVGLYFDAKGELDSIGAGGRMYETMAFMAKFEDPYWEADVQKQVNFDSGWALSEAERETDVKAEEMHEATVTEISEKISAGTRLETYG